MPDDISFFSIPANLLDPGSYIEILAGNANGPLPALPPCLLLIGQRLTTGTVASGVLTRLQGPNDGKNFFGRGSMLAAMCEAKFGADNTVPTYAIACDDASGGVAAVWHALFAGTATAAGSATIYIGGPQKNNLTSGQAVTIAVPVGMTAAQASAAMAAAIDALLDLPVTAAADGVTAAQVDITCRWKGASGNDLDLRSHYYHGDAPPAGLTLTITQGTQGATNPTLTAAIAAMGAKWFTGVVLPYTDPTSIGALTAELERRWGSTVQQDGILYSMTPLSLGAAETLGATLNEKLYTLPDLPKCPSASWINATVIGAVTEYYASIDPAAPLDSSIVLPGICAPATGDQLQHTDRQALMQDGIATLAINANGDVTFNRLITTYQVDANGLPDASYLDVEGLKTLAYLRFWVRQRIATRWPRYKLADDPPSGQSLPRGQKVTCPKLIKLDLISGSQALYNAGIIDDLDAFAAGIVVERDQTNRAQVNALLPWTLIGRFRVFAGQILFNQ